MPIPRIIGYCSIMNQPMNTFTKDYGCFCKWAKNMCLGGACLLILTACESSQSQLQSSAPPSSPLGSRDALAAAMDLQDAEEGRQAGLGRGASMEPLYGENAVLIIVPIEFSELKRGMLVAYRNAQGHRVVHQLVERDSYGWVAMGLNNGREDRERVTVYNLEGVVYGALFADN